MHFLAFSGKCAFSCIFRKIAFYANEMKMRLHFQENAHFMQIDEMKMKMRIFRKMRAEKAKNKFLI